MSYQKPKQDEPKYEDVSLDEFVLVSIVQNLQNAHNLMLSRDYEAALAACDLIYIMLPAGVAPKDLQSPLDEYQEKVKLIPLEKDIRKIIRLTEPLTEEEVEFYGNLNDRIAVHKAKYYALRRMNIAQPLIRNFSRVVKDGLERKGLWITANGKKIIPTSERPMEVAPRTQRVEATYPR